MAMSTSAQTRAVTGVVYDPTGEPLPGATVTIQGTTQAVATDVNGHFTLQAANGQVLQYNSSAGKWQNTTAGSIIATSAIVRETPTGAINGSNTVFTLANVPIPGTEMVYYNGLLQDSGAGNDYTISGNVITFNIPLQIGDKVRVSYNK